MPSGESENTMFKPDRTFKKLASKYGTCAYIYKDGVVLVERREVKSGEYSTNIEITHIWHAEIKLYSSNNGNEPIKRIVVHDAAELLSGIERIRVYFHNGSEKSKAENLELWSISCLAPNGMEWTRNACNLVADNFTIQPNPQERYTRFEGGDSVDCWTDGNVEIHN